MKTKLELNNEELRTLILETLKENKESQFVSFNNCVANKALSKGLLKQNTSGYYAYTNAHLEKEDTARVQNILWDLIIEGIIRPGLGDGTNNDLPFFHVTEKGEQILSSGISTPYDPDSYLKQLLEDIPNIDRVVVNYLEESLKTFRIGCYLSSTISLGCASEKVFLLLIESFKGSMSNEDSKAKFTKAIEGKTIKRQYDEFMKYYSSTFKQKLNGDLKEGFDTTVLGVFEMIRMNRNDAGHPTGKEIERDVLYANLIVFKTYIKKVYQLISWLSQNQI